MLWQICFSSPTLLLNLSACSTGDNPATINTAQMELSSSPILSFRHRWKAEGTADFPLPVMYSLLNTWLNREVTKHPLNDLDYSRHLGFSLAQSDTSAGTWWLDTHNVLTVAGEEIKAGRENVFWLGKKNKIPILTHVQWQWKLICRKLDNNIPGAFAQKLCCEHAPEAVFREIAILHTAFPR